MSSLIYKLTNILEVLLDRIFLYCFLIRCSSLCMTVCYILKYSTMQLSLRAMYVHGKPFHVIAMIVWINFFDRVSEELIRALTWVLRKRRPNVGISMFQPNWKTNPQQFWSLGATIVSRGARPSRNKFNEISKFIPVYTAAAIHLRQRTHKNTAVCKDNTIYTCDTMQYKADCEAVTGNHVTLSATIQLMLIYVGVCQH